MFITYVYINTVLGPNEGQHNIYLWLISLNNPLPLPLLLPLKIAFKSIWMMWLVTTVAVSSLITRTQNSVTSVLGESSFQPYFFFFCPLGYQRGLFWVLPLGTRYIWPLRPIPSSNFLPVCCQVTYLNRKRRFLVWYYPGMSFLGWLQ